MSATKYAIGLDYGTNSVRALVVACADGREVGTCVFDYPSGDQGILLDPKDPHLARQNPADYVVGLEAMGLLIFALLYAPWPIARALGRRAARSDREATAT